MERELCSECKIILPDCVCELPDSKFPKTNLFNRYYNNLTSFTIPGMFQYKRSYEGMANYLIVFAPLKNHVDKTTDLKWIEKHCRNIYQYHRIIITKEIKETRIHYNAVVTTKENPLLQNGTIKNTFYINSQHIPNQDHLDRVVKYIFKESKRREYYPNQDYFIFLKN